LAYKPYVREFIKSLIPNVKIIHLKVDMPVLLEKMLIRWKSKIAQQGMTMEQMWARDNDRMK
jgi:gluconate kinase